MQRLDGSSCSNNEITARPLRHSQVGALTQSIEQQELNFSFSCIPIPNIPDLGKVKTAHEKNQAISDWYHEIDLALTPYLGAPSWAHFAKHASYTAGEQIRNIEETIQGLDALAQLLELPEKTTNSGFVGFFQNLLHYPKCLIHLYHEIVDILQHKDLVQTLFAIALNQISESKSGINNRSAILSVMLNPLEAAREAIKLRPLLQEMQKTLSEANIDIFNFMAPRLHSFFNTLNSGESEKYEAEPTACFLDTGLKLYQQAHLLNKFIETNHNPNNQIHLEQRNQLILEANLKITFGEQLYRVQPKFDQHLDLLRQVAGVLSYRTPNSDTRLAAESPQVDWTNIYQRMGLDSENSPSDPYRVTPHSFPKLLTDKHPHFSGTIGSVMYYGTLNQEVGDKLLPQPEKLEVALDW